MKGDLIPKGMSGDEWVGHIGDILNIQPFGKKVTPCDTTERINKAIMLKDTIQAFMEKPKELFKEKIQSFYKTSDLPEPVNNVFDMFTDNTNFDMGWMPAFKDASQFLVNGKWEIVTNSEAPIWRLIPEGDAVRVTGGSATLVDCEVAKHGAALGWTDEMIRFRRVSQMLDMAEDFRKTKGQYDADKHYALLANAAHDTFGGLGATNDLYIDTINGAAYNLLEGLKDTRNLPAETQILLYAPVQAKAIINRAISTVNQEFQGSRNRLEYNVTPIYTFNSNLPDAATGTGYGCLMVVPGLKIQRAEAMPVTMYNDTDILSLTFITSAFTYYGAYVADANQVLGVDLDAT